MEITGLNREDEKEWASYVYNSNSSTSYRQLRSVRFDQTFSKFDGREDLQAQADLFNCERIYAWKTIYKYIEGEFFMITREQIEKIVKKIVSSCRLERIILFGSYAYGNPTENSDLDLLVVIKSSNLPRYKRAREIRKHLWGVTDIPKDILVYTEEEIEEWKEVEEAFITKVLREGRILYDENKRGTDKELA